MNIEHTSESAARLAAVSWHSALHHAESVHELVPETNSSHHDYRSRTRRYRVTPGCVYRGQLLSLAAPLGIVLGSSTLSTVIFVNGFLKNAV
jgi:hypothetical protein